MAHNQQKNLKVIQHWFDTVNSNDLERILKEIAEIISDDYMIYDPATPDMQPGAANYLKIFKRDMVGSADRKITVGDMFAVDDKVVVRADYEFLELASQERKKFAAMVISQFEGGKIKAEWQITAPYASSAN